MNLFVFFVFFWQTLDVHMVHLYEIMLNKTDITHNLKIITKYTMENISLISIKVQHNYHLVIIKLY